MIQLLRKKKWNPLLSLAYKFQKLIPVSNTKKLKLFLDLSWIFGRLAHEVFPKTGLTVPYNPAQDFLLVNMNKGAAVLDIGCGRGFVAKRILNKTDDIVGIDYDNHAIDEAKKKFQNSRAEFICIDAFDYFKLYNDKKFDIIVLSHVLEHIDDPKSFLEAIKGKADFFYIEVPDWEASHLNVYRLAVKTDLIYTDADHIYEFDRASLLLLFNSVGLSVTDFDHRHGVLRYWLARKG